MKTFDELTEVVHCINEMEEIFQSVVILTCHQAKIERFTVLTDQVKNILVRDIHRVDDLCTEEPATCADYMNCVEGKEE